VLKITSVKSQGELIVFNTNDYKTVDSCRCCGGKSLSNVLDLGSQPLANSYHTLEQQLNEYPLSLNVCNDCYHSQLSVVVSPDLMFKNYLYVSGTTDTLRSYFDFFSKFTVERYIAKNENRPKSILDIACNDGTQLDYYHQLGLKTYGIDPAENLVPTISDKHEVLCGYFPEDKFSKKFSIITAQNVFAHTDDIKSFLDECRESLEDNGIVYIQTSQSNMFKRNEFDTIYHEHLSFFNTKSMKTIVERCGLVLNNVFKFSVHGSSYIFEISKQKIESNVESVLCMEEKNGLYCKNTYKQFAQKASKVTRDLKEKVLQYQIEGYKVIGYGAAAKGMTVLNYGSIKLDAIIDDNPLKVGLYTPGTNTKIVDSQELNLHEKLVIVPLAWNFFSEIKSRTSKKRKMQTIFINYFPELDISYE